MRKIPLQLPCLRLADTMKMRGDLLSFSVGLNARFHLHFKMILYEMKISRFSQRKQI